jgi:hypothetical protein
LRQPFRIAHIGHAAGHILDMEGVDDQGGNAGRLKMGKTLLQQIPVLSITTYWMRCVCSQATKARMSRLNPPNSRVSLDTAPSSWPTKMVTTCFMRCTSMPATR